MNIPFSSCCSRDMLSLRRKYSTAKSSETGDRHVLLVHTNTMFIAAVQCLLVLVQVACAAQTQFSFESRPAAIGHKDCKRNGAAALFGLQAEHDDRRMRAEPDTHSVVLEPSASIAAADCPAS